MANQDPPEHTRLRRLTSGAFAPAKIRAISSHWKLGENRTLTSVDGEFEDDFDDFSVHIYRVSNP